MDMQKQEMREAVELPLSHFDLYKQIGIDPPRGLFPFLCSCFTQFLAVLVMFLLKVLFTRRCPDVRPPWLWQDYVGKSCCSSHHR